MPEDEVSQWKGNNRVHTALKEKSKSWRGRESNYSTAPSLTDYLTLSCMDTHTHTSHTHTPTHTHTTHTSHPFIHTHTHKHTSHPFIHTVNAESGLSKKTQIGTCLSSTDEPPARRQNYKQHTLSQSLPSSK